MEQTSSGSGGSNKRRSISPPPTTAMSPTATKRTTTSPPKNPKPLPIETLTNILTRLPTKTLTQFESVSKLWYALIHSSSFISAHLRRSSTASPPFVLLRCYSPTLFAVSLIHPISGNLRVFKVPFIGSLSRYPKVVASCNGLLCLDVSGSFASNFVLWNLFTSQFRGLPLPLIDDSQRAFWMVSTGFGYNRGVDDYKIVRVVNFVCGAEGEVVTTPLVRAEVYSLRLDSWRVIDHGVAENVIGSYAFGEGGKGVCVNGVVYWVAREIGKMSGDAKCIVSFDLGSEKFDKIKIPEVDNDICIKVIEFEERFALAVYPASNVYPGYGRNLNRIELLMLDGYGSNCASWRKLHTVRASGSPVGVVNNCELMVKVKERNWNLLCFVNLHTDEQTRLSVCESEYHCDIHTYVESLVSVSPIDDEGIMEETS